MDARALYEEQAVHRGTALGLLINTEDLYLRRLSVAGAMLSLIERESVLDVGCGYGDLVDRLPAATPYLGLDMTPWILDEARARHPHNDFEYFNFGVDSDPTPRPIVVGLGLLATVEPREQGDFIRRLAELSSRWLLLSWVDAARYGGRLCGTTETCVRGVLGEPEYEMRLRADATVTSLFRLRS